MTNEKEESVNRSMVSISGIGDLLFKALSEDRDVSMMRLVLLSFAAFFIPAFTYIWIKTAHATGQFPDIPSGVTWTIGTVLSGKVLQKFIEKV